MPLDRWLLNLLWTPCKIMPCYVLLSTVIQLGGHETFRDRNDMLTPECIVLNFYFCDLRSQADFMNKTFELMSGKCYVGCMYCFSSCICFRGWSSVFGMTVSHTFSGSPHCTITGLCFLLASLYHLVLWSTAGVKSCYRKDILHFPGNSEAKHEICSPHRLVFELGISRIQVTCPATS
jgi:hypothetical protein